MSLVENMQTDVDGTVVVPHPETTESLTEMGQEMILLRTTIDELEGHAKELRRTYDDLRQRKIPETMEACGMVGPNGKGSFTLEDGSTIFLKTSLYASYDKSTEEEVFDWLRANELGDIIKLTVHNATFRATIKELFEDGRELPAIIKAHPFKTAQVRRQK